MTILGIETSCDETAAAVCREGVILSSIISSQQIHTQYGGVVPEIASREHERWLTSVVQRALEEAEVEIHQLNGVAVTRGPGLMGALLTGVSFARGLSQGLRIPCIGINHIEGHIFSNFIQYPELKYPFLCLLVSGGHTQIWLVKAFGQLQLLGETRDDAAGEAFDKGARILGLNYPGGPAIEKAAIGGNEEAISFPQSFLNSDNIEFSFSGLKTALLYFVKRHGRNYVKEHLSDIAASYQRAIIHILIMKLKQAKDCMGINRVVIAGGVAANKKLRELAKQKLKDCIVFYPYYLLCTDNAAMIAYLGEEYLQRERGVVQDLEIVPNLKLGI